MTNLEALRKLEMYCPTSCDKAITQLRRALEALEAVEVLDARAKSDESRPPAPSYVGVTSKVDGERLGYWRISLNLRALQGDCQGMFASAHAARIAAAAAVKESR